MTTKKSRGTKTKTQLKKAESQKIAIQDRRNIVKLYLHRHMPIRDIAENLKVSIKTVEADIKAIDEEYAGLHNADRIGRKQRELEELDAMEAECLLEVSKMTERLERYLDKPEEHLGNLTGNQIKPILAAVSNHLTLFFDRRLKIKQTRAAWLGFDKPEPDPTTPGISLIQDNRKVVINMNGKEVDFMEWLEEDVIPTEPSGEVPTT